MDDFFLPVVSAADLLPRVALATQVAMETAREHGLQLNMASKKTEGVVDFRGKERQQVLEDLALEFLVVDGQWTPNVKVAEGIFLRLVSTFRHLGTQASHGATMGQGEVQSSQLVGLPQEGVPGHAQEDFESERCSATLNGYARKWSRSLWRWMVFPNSRGCGLSSRTPGCCWCLRASGSSWNVVSGRRPAPVSVVRTFSCDECDAVYDKLRALRSHQMRAHQRRWEARRYVLDSISPSARRVSGRDRGSRCVLA